MSKWSTRRHVVSRHKQFCKIKFPLLLQFLITRASPEAPVTTAIFPSHFSIAKIFLFLILQKHRVELDNVDHLTSHCRMTIREQIAADFQYFK